MGSVFAEITLTNVYDVALASEGYIKEKDIRSLTVNALVDTGAISLCMNEEIRIKLGLKIDQIRPIRLANGEYVICQQTEPVDITWKEPLTRPSYQSDSSNTPKIRSSACKAIVIPGAEFVLLGAIPLEDLDLKVDPREHKLVGIHGDEWVCDVMIA